MCICMLALVIFLQFQVTFIEVLIDKFSASAIAGSTFDPSTVLFIVTATSYSRLTNCTCPCWTDLHSVTQSHNSLVSFARGSSLIIVVLYSTMERCQGLPDRPCPDSRCDATVKNTIYDLFLCRQCELKRDAAKSSASSAVTVGSATVGATAADPQHVTDSAAEVCRR